MLIQTGVWMFTDCENYYYREIITYRWNGSGFVQLASAPPTPPDSRKPDKCAIEWAFAAGSDNVSAVNLLAAAVADWPSEAEEVWGPAAHDYFKLKLASWYLSLGQVQRGIELFEQVRDAPSEPKFQFTSQVATTFLETAEAKGIYQATLAVDSLFEKTWKSMCETLGCTRDKILEQCGFAELEWGIEYGGFAMSELYSFDAISLELNQNPPTSMGDLRIQLQNMGLTPIWIGEADVDGLGQPDWLVDLRSSQMLFLRQNGRLIRIELPIYFLKSKPENRTHIWEIYELGSHAPGINIYQIGNDLFAFHLSKENGMYEVVFDVDSTYLATPAEPEHFEMQEWSVQDGNLIVQYDGGKGIYVWDHEGKGVDPWKGFNGSLVPTGYSPELFEENISRAEQALYLEDNPVQAIEILTKLLEDHILENYTWSGSAAPRLRPYAQYLLGLAYERRGDSENAVRLYWQLWHDYPTNPFALAAQSKLEFK
jgi:tetratricopeptide (TPR) repeat protein